jgi:hypothetical protein
MWKKMLKMPEPFPKRERNEETSIIPIAEIKAEPELHIDDSELTFKNEPTTMCDTVETDKFIAPKAEIKTQAVPYIQYNMQYTVKEEPEVQFDADMVVEENQTGT